MDRFLLKRKSANEAEVEEVHLKRIWQHRQRNVIMYEYCLNYCSAWMLVETGKKIFYLSPDTGKESGNISTPERGSRKLYEDLQVSFFKE